MSEMKIAVNREKCIGAGQCTLNAPDLFDQDDDGTVVVLHERPTHEQQAAARNAEHTCPAHVITLT
jgi:ferredoxin